MPTKSFKATTILSILLFCSCSDISDTAQAPEMAPAVSQASQQPEKEPLPAAVMLQSQELFGSIKSKDLKFAEDPLLQSQDSFDEIDTGEKLSLEQGDFSQGIIPNAK